MFGPRSDLSLLQKVVILLHHICRIALSSHNIFSLEAAIDQAGLIVDFIVDFFSFSTHPPTRN
jgi:hypothetical protein